MTEYRDIQSNIKHASDNPICRDCHWAKYSTIFDVAMLAKSNRTLDNCDRSW